MKRKAKKALKIIIICAVIAAVAAAAVIFVVLRKNSKTADVYMVGDISEPSYYYSNSELTGTVTDGRVQKVVMKEGLVKEVLVKEGDSVKVGDILMVYDTTSLDLTLQSDAADIAVQEAELSDKKEDLARYKTLRPSEEAPDIEPETQDNGPLELIENLTASYLKKNNAEYKVSVNSKIAPDFLKKLRKKGYTAYLKVYQDETLFGTFVIDGKNIPQTVYEYTEQETTEPASLNPEETTPEQTSEELTSEEPSSEEPTSEEPSSEETTTEQTSEEPTSEEPSSEEPVQPSTEVPSETSSDEPETTGLFIRTEKDPAETEWILSNVLSFDGDSVSFKTGTGYTYYGTFESCTPETYERYEYVDTPFVDYGDNYIYSRAELAEMITNLTKEIKQDEINLEIAKIDYQTDLKISESGEVKATVAGTVTQVLPVSAAQEGDEVIVVKGSENYSVTINVNELDLANVEIGDMMSIMSYETGCSATAVVTEIGTSPATSYYSYGSNPNTSVYPVTAVVQDSEVEMNVGEYCSASFIEEGETGDSFCLPLMYVRSDSGGSYVMADDGEGKLEKRYIKTGQNYYGYMVEVKSGITAEDYIAFPYDAGAKEGTKTVIPDEDDMYYYW